ncbi:hypothetical protein YC2023_091121 [Brassica napus]
MGEEFEVSCGRSNFILVKGNSLGTLSLSQFPACCPDGLGSVSDSRMASSASVVDSLAPAVHLLLRWLLTFGYVITPSSPVLIVASLREFSRVKSISASSYSSEPSPVVLIIDHDVVSGCFFQSEAEILWRLVVTILALSLAKVVRQLHLTRCPALVYSGGPPVRCSGDGFLAVDDVKSLLTRAPPFYDACSS